MTSATSGDRRLAIAAADGTCPRCGAARAFDQRYCLQCGLALPIVMGRLPALRRRWIRRVGWYPGDWMWVSLATLVVAVGGAGAAIAVTKHRQHNGLSYATVARAVPVREPVVSVPATTSATPATLDTSKLPTAPEPTSPGAPNGRTVWPANESGWTIVLVSYPKTFGHAEALTTASRAAKKGLGQVGVIDSSGFASLQPGYFVVFTGVYASKADADAAVATARQAGFAGSYSREISR